MLNRPKTGYLRRDGSDMFLTNSVSSRPGPKIYLSTGVIFHPSQKRVGGIRKHGLRAVLNMLSIVEKKFIEKVDFMKFYTMKSHSVYSMSSGWNRRNGPWKWLFWYSTQVKIALTEFNKNGIQATPKMLQIIINNLRKMLTLRIFIRRRQKGCNRWFPAKFEGPGTEIDCQALSRKSKTLWQNSTEKNFKLL